MSETKYAAQKKWGAENLKRFNIAFTKKSGMIDALERMETATGEKQADYIKRAVKEQLQFDGFLDKD